MLVHERFGLFKAHFLALHGIYEVLFEFFDLFGRGAFDRIHAGALYKRAFAHGEQLHALRGAVCPLVVLACEVGDGKHGIVPAELHLFPVDVVYGRFGEYAGDGGFELFLRHALHVVADEQADVGYVVYGEQVLRLLLHLFGL